MPLLETGKGRWSGIRVIEKDLASSLLKSRSFCHLAEISANLYEPVVVSSQISCRVLDQEGGAPCKAFVPDQGPRSDRLMIKILP